MAILADIISARVVDELLTVIRVRGTYNEWVDDNTAKGFADLHTEYMNELNLDEDELAELRGFSKKMKPSKTKLIESEADLIGEMASLMTKKGMYLENEEYEKITPIVARIVEVKKLLKDNYNVNMDLNEDDE